MDNSLTALIESLMGNIKTVMDVKTVVGEPIKMPQDTLIIPISRLSFGIGAGGSEFGTKDKDTPSSPMFGGGGGGGAKVVPMAFLVINNGNVRLLPLATDKQSPLDKLVDMAPELIDKLNKAIMGRAEKKTEDDNEL